MSTMPSPDLLLPEPHELHGHLVDQLDFLRNRNGKLSRNKNSFRTNWSKLKDTDPETWTLDIDPNWVVKLTTPDHLARTHSRRDFAIEDGFAVIGGLIEAKENQFTQYSLHLTLLARHDSEVRGAGIDSPCCWTPQDNHTKWRVARRYHFDVDIGDNDDEDKPITHLQSGGKFNSSHLPAGIQADEIHYCSSPLDKPRLPHPPMDPILLFQLVSEQYNCPDDLKSEHWNPKVLSAEKKLWKKYYNRLSEFVSVDGRSTPFNGFLSNGRLE